MQKQVCTDSECMCDEVRIVLWESENGEVQEFVYVHECQLLAAYNAIERECAERGLMGVVSK